MEYILAALCIGGPLIVFGALVLSEHPRVLVVLAVIAPVMCCAGFLITSWPLMLIAVAIGLLALLGVAADTW